MLYPKIYPWRLCLTALVMKRWLLKWPHERHSWLCWTFYDQNPFIIFIHNKKNSWKEWEEKQEWKRNSFFVIHWWGQRGVKINKTESRTSDMVNGSVQQIITVVMLLGSWWLLVKKMLWMQEWEQYPDTQTSSLISVLQVLNLDLLMVMSGPHDAANKIFVYLYNLRYVFSAWSA